MHILASDSTFSYVKMEEPRELESFQIRGEESGPEGFEFFRGLGIIGYARTFKMWLRKFPRPIFLAALRGRELVSWVFVEESPERARDGEPVYILRAIETLPGLRRQKIGFRLLLLACAQVSGYLLTKPLTKDAHRFFTAAGFVEFGSLERPPIPATQMPGYLVLLPQARARLVEGLPAHFSTIVSP